MDAPRPPKRSCGTSACPNCGKSFTCDYACGKPTCWCASLPQVLPVPNTPADCGGCLCPACLAAAVRKVNAEAHPSPPPSD